MPFVTASRDSILAMPIDILFDFVAVQIDGPKAADADIRIDFEFTDEGVRWTMWIRRGVLNARRGSSPPQPPLTVSGPKAALVGVLVQPGSAQKLQESGAITLDGDEQVLSDFAALLDEFDPSFPIVTP